MLARPRPPLPPPPLPPPPPGPAPPRPPCAPPLPGCLTEGIHAQQCSPPRRRPRNCGCGRWSTSTTSSARCTSASGSKSPSDHAAHPLDAPAAASLRHSLAEINNNTKSKKKTWVPAGAACGWFDPPGPPNFLFLRSFPSLSSLPSFPVLPLRLPSLYSLCSPFPVPVLSRFSPPSFSLSCFPLKCSGPAGSNRTSRTSGDRVVLLLDVGGLSSVLFAARGAYERL